MHRQLAVPDLCPSTLTNLSGKPCLPWVCCCAQTSLGGRQAQDAGQAIRRHMESAKGTNYQLFFYTSPYKRSIQTCMGIR
jgi:broad specificity phosphatase PhoE